LLTTVRFCTRGLVGFFSLMLTSVCVQV
jgi:hypothetical protein